MSISFHRATATDLPTLMQLMKAFHDFDHAQPFDTNPARAAMETVVTNDPLGRAWLIEQSQEQAKEIVGYMVLTLAYRLEYRGYYAFLDELYICEDKRGRGIGTLAMQFLLEACQKLEVKKLQLEVKQDNPQASSLYTKVGLTPQSRKIFTQSFL